MITITNENPEKSVRSFYYHIDYSEETLPEKTAYFCAQYRNEFPEKTGKDYLIMETEGEGRYVGTVMSVRSRSPFWFGEGDARFYVDGDKKPTIQGTGTEDYFLMAWGLNENQFPYYGCIYMSQDFEDLGRVLPLPLASGRPYPLLQVSQVRNRAYRLDQRGRDGKRQDRGHVEREDDIATVAFWYQTGLPKRFTKIRRSPSVSSRISTSPSKAKTLLPTAKHSPGVVRSRRATTGPAKAASLPALDGTDPGRFRDHQGRISRPHPAFHLRRGLRHLQDLPRRQEPRQPADYMAGQKIQDYDFYSGAEGQG